MIFKLKKKNNVFCVLFWVRTDRCSKRYSTGGELKIDLGQNMLFSFFIFLFTQSSVRSTGTLEGACANSRA